jgi:quinol monooxygenase YgiN
MERIVIVCYRPKPGKEKTLEKLVKNHVPALKREGWVSDRVPVVMKSKDGTVIEIFGWKSAEAIEAAHSSSVVQDMWKEFQEACDYEVPTNVEEFSGIFSEFSPM